MGSRKVIIFKYFFGILRIEKESEKVGSGRTLEETRVKFDVWTKKTLQSRLMIAKILESLRRSFYNSYMFL